MKGSGNLYINGLREVDSGSIWKWKGFGGSKRRNEDKRFSVAEFLRENGRRFEKAVEEGPGAAIGIGCGVGLGMGVVGGFGVTGSEWNKLKAVFGVGIGCGIGLGIGYGKGIGYGTSLDSIWSRLLDPEEEKSSRKPLLLLP